jgi:lipoprotein-anchoring transpeptidase ErfK/SrfK
LNEEIGMLHWAALVVGIGFGLAIATEAEAQGRSWVPWEGGGQSSWRRSTPPPSAPRRQSRSWWDDDDDDDGSVFGSRGQPRSAYKYPPILEGGPRPAINPSAPPQVRFASGHPTGSIVIDTAGRALYYVTSSTSAYRYPISVGREGFTWRGTEKISRVQAWPDWRPPAEMRQRDPNLPELMTGGVNNPLGAKALYLGSTLYRIHGTNDSRTIGYAASSGCFRMMNAHVEHLSTIAGVGTTVHVLDRLPRIASAR